MDSRSFRTPQKPFHRHSPTMKFVAATKLLSTPQSKFKGPETPKSLTQRTPGHFSLFPILNTPPTRFPKVVNPFEAALTERLHLPLICSPSLFQRPSTPQHSSTQFEWTIDDVSSLGPVNVEPHETQFQATPDPDLEAKAQAAISSYFKDQIFVPSPVDCQLRNRKIVLHDSNDYSPAVRPGRRIRDGLAQTVLSIPPVVPLEVENMLKIYFTYTADQQQSPTINCDSATIDYEAQDISLRRKLFSIPSPRDGNEKDEESCDFEISEIDDNREHSPPPVSPELDSHSIPLRGFGSPFGKSSFGSLSPISKIDSAQNTPKRYCGQQDETLNNTAGFVDADFDDVPGTPKSPPPTSSIESVGCSLTHDQQQQNQSLFRSTPDRSIIVSSIVDMSVDRSYNKSSNRLAMNSSKKLFQHDLDCNTTTTSEHSSFIVIDDDEDDDGMQISQLSAKSTGSSSGSSQHPDTPVRKHRSASRKNLSRSFSCPITDDEDEDFDAGMIFFKKSFGRTKSNPDTMENHIELSHTTITATMMDTTELSVVYRADSGFNEMTTQDESKFRNEIDEMKRKSPIFERDISMC